MLNGVPHRSSRNEYQTSGCERSARYRVVVPPSGPYAVSRLDAIVGPPSPRDDCVARDVGAETELRAYGASRLVCRREPDGGYSLVGTMHTGVYAIRLSGSPRRTPFVRVEITQGDAASACDDSTITANGIAVAGVAQQRTDIEELQVINAASEIIVAACGGQPQILTGDSLYALRDYVTLARVRRGIVESPSAVTPPTGSGMGAGYSSGGTSGGDVHVRGYTRSNGTYVAPHSRAAPGHGGGRHR